MLPRQYRCYVCQPSHAPNLKILFRQDGASAMFCAAQEGHWHVIQSLVRRTADVNARLNKGPTPLYIAAQEGYESLVTNLIQCKGSPDHRAHVSWALAKGHTRSFAHV